MKKSLLCLLLALCLTGCAPAAPPSSASVSVPSPAVTVQEETEPSRSLPQAADVPPGSYAPWQEAYAGFLTNLRSAEYQHVLGDLAFAGDDIPSDSYSLYDVDKDGVPELFLKRGTCEADYCTQAYTFWSGQMAELGGFQSGHTSLYSCPSENAILVQCAHMGHGEIDKFSLEDGAIGPWKTLLTEGEVENYTYPGDLVPGSEPIPYFYTCTQFRPSDSPALVLPVYDWQGRDLPVPMDEPQVRAAVERVLYDGAPLFGVSGNGFHGDAGLTTLEEYLRPGTAYPYGSAPLEIKQIAWADVNGDGQTDCLLRMEQKRETWTDTFCTVLSVEGDTVYAYFFDGVRDAAVAPDGAVTLQFYGSSWKRASFFKNQSYTVPAPEPVQGDGLAWDPFS